MTTMGPTNIIECPSCGQRIRQYTYNSYNNFGTTHYWTDGDASDLFGIDRKLLVKCANCDTSFLINDAKRLGAYDGERAGSWRQLCRMLEEYVRDGKELKSDNSESIISNIKNNLPAIPRPDSPDCTEEARELFMSSHEFIAVNDEKEYLDYLDSNTASAENEKYLRIMAWYIANDEYRVSIFPLNEDDINIVGSLYDGDITKTCFTPKQINNLEKLSNLLEDNNQADRLMKAEIARECALFEQALSLLKYEFDEGFSGYINAIKILSKKEIAIVANIETVLEQEMT
ncbi:MAG: hypothetical protein ACQ9ET_03560 [Nitrosomonadaceae bacterium]